MPPWLLRLTPFPRTSGFLSLQRSNASCRYRAKWGMKKLEISNTAHLAHGLGERARRRAAAKSAGFVSGQKRDCFPVGLEDRFSLAGISGHGFGGFCSLGVGTVERFGLGLRGRLTAALRGKTPDVGRHSQRLRRSFLRFANGLGQDNLCGLGGCHGLTGLLDRLLGLLKIRCLSVAHADGAVIL